jgi:CheY-like chemotaxis protein/anti-sigma regulatory factor (Ser/Thr protein kinase)
MDELMEAALRASTLVNQLMTLGRQQILEPTLVSMTAFLRRLRPSLGRVLPADITLAIEIPTDDLAVCLDETGLERSLLNLVLNARDAMPRGGTIRVSCQTQVVGTGDPQLTPGTYVTIIVSDTGVGMNRETLDRIFDPFFTTKGEKGTGLGLSSVYAFAKETGGSVDVTSEEERGTIFTLRLPEAVGPVDGVPAPPARHVPAATRQDARILVVEDREDVRATMTRALSRSGFEVREASSGDEALTVLAGQRDITLMCIDGVMPGLSTAEAIARAQQLVPGLPVIVCSGHVQEELLRRGIEAGRYAFLPKPFSPQELVARVCQSLEHRPVRKS